MAADRYDELMARHTALEREVSKMHAVCVRCRGAAHYSQRLTGGNAQVEVGDSSYEARCRHCFDPRLGQ